METICFRKPAPCEQAILNRVEVILPGGDEAQGARFDALMEADHYLHNSQLVGERVRRVAVVRRAMDGVVELECRRLSPQGPRRLDRLERDPPPVCDFTRRRLPEARHAGPRAQVSANWAGAYGHPLLMVESFVDSQWFHGTCYRAQGWTLLGQTQGYGRHAEDYDTGHERPKQLWVRELAGDARATLRAAELPLALQAVEHKVLPRAAVPIKALHVLVERCRQVAARKNTRQSTLKDFHDTMDRHQHRDARRLIQA